MTIVRTTSTPSYINPFQNSMKQKIRKRKNLNQPEEKIAKIGDPTDKRTGIACRWIGVGSLNPSLAILCNK